MRRRVAPSSAGSRSCNRLGKAVLWKLWSHRSVWRCEAASLMADAVKGTEIGLGFLANANRFPPPVVPHPPTHPPTEQRDLLVSSVATDRLLKLRPLFHDKIEHRYHRLRIRRFGLRPPPVTVVALVDPSHSPRRL
ncbi:hypothetical protein GW17_00050848 [Ensete ventricosum]|nr:hypothetical protein GW17_00050848 [Ensete ventricosum]